MPGSAMADKMEGQEEAGHSAIDSAKSNQAADGLAERVRPEGRFVT